MRLKYILLTIFLLGISTNTKAFATPVNSYIHEEDKSSENNLGASTLDMTFEAMGSNFSPSVELRPTDNVSEDFQISNIGNADIQHNLQYDFDSGNSGFCDQLDLEVTHTFGATTQTEYTGKLKDFSLNLSANNTDFDLSTGDTHDYSYEISLPAETPASYSNLECVFNIEAKAWQTPLDYSQGFTDIETVQSTIKSGKWYDEELLITAYSCPSGTAVTGDNRPDADGNYTVPSGCSETEDMRVGYIFQDGKLDLSSPYPGLLPDTTPFTPFSGSTNSTGELLIKNLETDGRYMLSWLDLDDNQISNDYMYGFMCYGDSGTSTNNYEATFVPVDGITHCALYLKDDLSRNAGDIIINELMWMGSTLSSNDEWIELYNDTGSDIDISGWTIEGAGNGNDAIELPTGSVINAHSYFLISNYDEDDANSELSNSNINVDVVESDIELDDGGETLTLKNVLKQEIDKYSGGSWPAGIDSSDKKSMERNNDPDSGWHTCEDAYCTSTDFWDNDADNWATPKAENKSENDPSDESYKAPAEEVIEPVQIVEEILIEPESIVIEPAIVPEEQTVTEPLEPVIETLPEPTEEQVIEEAIL